MQALFKKVLKKKQKVEENTYESLGTVDKDLSMHEENKSLSEVTVQEAAAANPKRSRNCAKVSFSIPLETTTPKADSEAKPSGKSTDEQLEDLQKLIEEAGNSSFLSSPPRTPPEVSPFNSLAWGHHYDSPRPACQFQPYGKISSINNATSFSAGDAPFEAVKDFKGSSLSLRSLPSVPTQSSWRFKRQGSIRSQLPFQTEGLLLTNAQNKCETIGENIPDSQFYENGQPVQMIRSITSANRTKPSVGILSRKYYAANYILYPTALLTIKINKSFLTVTAILNEANDDSFIDMTSLGTLEIDPYRFTSVRGFNALQVSIRQAQEVSNYDFIIKGKISLENNLHINPLAYQELFTIPVANQFLLHPDNPIIEIGSALFERLKIPEVNRANNKNFTIRNTQLGYIVSGVVPENDLILRGQASQSFTPFRFTKN